MSFTSKTDGFESYNSHQLLCSWKVEVSSEPFRIARFRRSFYTHLDLFGGSKMGQFAWLLASQSGCCRFDPFCPRAWVVFFFQRLNYEKSKSCDVLLYNLKASRGNIYYVQFFFKHLKHEVV